MGVTEQLTSAGQVMLGISAVAATLIVVLALLAPSERRIRSWADRYGLELTDRNRPIISRYIRRTRSLRAIGGAAGWLAPMAFVAITNRPFPLGGNSLAVALGGYLLGAMIAEAIFMRPVRSGELRSASLVPRSLDDYISPFAVWALRLLPLVTVGLASFYTLIPNRVIQVVTQTSYVNGTATTTYVNVPSYIDPSHQFVVLISGMLVLFAIAVELILRAIVRRAQPVTSHDLEAADDAIRASSIHAFSGAAISVLLVGVAWGLATINAMTSMRVPHGGDGWSNALPWLAISTIVAAIFAWIYVGHPRTWKVRHRMAAPAVTAS